MTFKLSTTALGATITLLTLLTAVSWAANSTDERAATTPTTASDHFEVSLNADPLKVGADGVARLTFVVGDGFHWNQEYPAKVTLVEGTLSSGAVTAPRREFKQLKGDFAASPQRATVEIPLSAKTAGSDTLRVDTRFSVCSDRMCLIKKASIEAKIIVTP